MMSAGVCDTFRLQWNWWYAWWVSEKNTCDLKLDNLVLHTHMQQQSNSLKARIFNIGSLIRQTSQPCTKIQQNNKIRLGFNESFGFFLYEGPLMFFRLSLWPLCLHASSPCFRVLNYSDLIRVSSDIRPLKACLEDLWKSLK